LLWKIRRQTLTEVSFGEWLKRRRSALGLTQEQLALKLNCSTSALRKFESEERRPSAEIVEQLADIFSIPQEERKSFLSFARGDWQAISDAEHVEAPWRIAPVRAETQIEMLSPKHNLPLQLTSFIGRAKEQSEVIALLAKHRLVTLVGAGGIGKTRLSLEAAREVLDTFPGGLWFVELAPVSDSALVPQIIVNTLGLIDQANRLPQAILIDFLKARKSLLVLDNCEHLIQACAQLADSLLRSCPDLHILATSREALGIAGETVYLVPSLTTPDPLHSSLDTLSQYEAALLFVERAQAAMSGFTMTRDNAPAIAQVCHHLDGIPLALELAAARIRGLSVEQIASYLDDRFRLLTGGSRTALPRHQTLQALIDWSHNLLSEWERMLLHRLSVFAGGWTLDAAQSVCAGEGLESDQILDLLLRLVDKSLVIAETRGAETRYHMLETIRQYAHEKMWQAGEGERMRQRHLAYFVDLAERAEPNLRAFGMIEWLDRLEAELDNIRIALDYALESDIEAQLRMVTAIRWFWWIRGHVHEGREWLEQGLSIEAAGRGDQPLTPSRAMIRGKALNMSGFWYGVALDVHKAATYLEESMALFPKLGPAGKQGMAYALLSLIPTPSIYESTGKGKLEQCLALFREIGDKFGIAECLLNLTGAVINEDNDYEQAILFAEEHLALRREIGDLDGIATALTILGDLAFFSQDDYQKAIALYQEGIATFHNVGDKWAAGTNLASYGDIYLWHGNYEQATKILEEAKVAAQEFGDKSIIAFYFYSLGFIAWFRGDFARATQLISESLAISRDIDHNWLIASDLHALGDIALALGDEEKATQSYESELSFSQKPDLKMSLVFAFCGLGKVAWAKGNYELATKRFEEALKISQETNFKQGTFYALYNLGRVAQSRDEHATARAYYAEILEKQRQRIISLFKWGYLKTYVAAISYPLEGFAILAVVQNQMQRAARLLGAAENLYVPLRFEMSAKERTEHDQAIATARAALGEEAFAIAYEDGKKMTMDEAVAYALGDAEANVG